jgi:hypothetical protein
MAFGGQEWSMPGGTDEQVKMIRTVESNLKNALISRSEGLYVYHADARHYEEAVLGA